MDTGYPRDVDPSITGQPHQVTGEVPGLMGTYRGRLVTGWSCQRRYEALVPPHFLGFRPRTRPLSGEQARTGADGPYAAPRWSASHTAVDSRAPRATALPQWAIQAAMPSGVPET